MTQASVEITTNLEEIVGTYLGAWNARDPSERAAMLEKAVANEVEFIDPMKQLVGREALAAHIADVRETFPDVTFAHGGKIDAHNGVFRAPWVARRNGDVVLTGLDVDGVGPDGRLARILGFFDAPVE